MVNPGDDRLTPGAQADRNLTCCVGFVHLRTSTHNSLPSCPLFFFYISLSLRSRWTPIANSSWQVLFSTLEFTGSLQKLDLSGNPLKDPAVQSLCKTLRCPTCKLRILWWVWPGLYPEARMNGKRTKEKDVSRVKLSIIKYSLNPLDHSCDRWQTCYDKQIDSWSHKILIFLRAPH